MPVRNLARVLLLAMSLTGCGPIGETPFVLEQTDGALPDTPRNLPTHLDSEASPLAEVRVRLAFDGACLVGTEREGLKVWLIWPSAYWLDGETIVNGREEVVSLGDSATAIGGHYSFGEVDSRMTNKGPEECRQLPLFWVTSIRRGGT